MIIVTNVVNRTKTEAEWKWGIPKYFFNKLTLYQIFLCPVKGIVFQYPGEVDASCPYWDGDYHMANTTIMVNIVSIWKEYVIAC